MYTVICTDNIFLLLSRLYELFLSFYVHIISLSGYYTRQAAEQIFDIGKNNVDLIPLRVHSEEAFRGHLLMSFIASCVYILVNRYFTKPGKCTIGVFHAMKNQKCKVYEETALPQEPTKVMNDIYETLCIEAPSVITR